MAVYTHITAEELERFLGAFDLGRLKLFSGIAEGVENTNYKLTTQ
jgi:homoserine kinase type II